jgi:uncharacterized protein YidB (DUF937 family)
MGLLDGMENKVVDSMLGGSSNPLVTALLQMIHNSPGGLSGFVQSFHEKGMGDIMSSWVASGQNLPISAQQLQSVLGSGTLSHLAQQAGISPDAAGSQLSSVLPGLVDKLTPNGQMPQGNLMELAQQVLGSLGKGSAA